MKYILAPLLLSLFLCSASAYATPVLQLQGDKPVVINNAATSMEGYDIEVNWVKDYKGIPSKELRYCTVGQDSAQKYGVPQGVYFFDNESKQVGFIDFEYAEFCADVRLSPDESIIAVDSGMSLDRDWTFYSAPDMKKIGSVSYFSPPERPDLFWIRQDSIIYDKSTDMETQRSCGYDPCGPISVETYSFKTGKTQTLFSGTDLCDYYIADANTKTGDYEVDKLCQPTVKAWFDFPSDESAIRMKGSLNQ